MLKRSLKRTTEKESERGEKAWREATAIAGNKVCMLTLLHVSPKLQSRVKGIYFISIVKVSKS
jgi:hypothetical protein